METKSGQRNTGQLDELETGGRCWTRQTWMAMFGLWRTLHWERRGFSQVSKSREIATAKVLRRLN